MLNIVKRLPQSTLKHTPVDDCISVETLDTPEQDQKQFVASLEVFLDPDEGGLQTAVGIGATSQEAITSCAMHAERILDAFGVPIYSVAVMQKRHAQAVVASGRYARMPGGEKPIPSRVRVPPPLKFIGSSSTTQPPGGGEKERDEVVEMVLPRRRTSGRILPSAVKEESEEQLQPESAMNAKHTSSAGSTRGQKQNSPSASPPASVPKTLFERSNDPAEMLTLQTKSRRRVLRRMTEVEKLGNRLDESEEGKYLLVNVVTNRLPSDDETMLTFSFIDPNSLGRVEHAVQKINSYAERWGVRCHSDTIFKPTASSGGGQQTEEVGIRVEQGTFDGANYHIAKKTFRFQKKEGTWIEFAAIGKAQSLERALQLMGMHAELLFDHHHIPLYPEDSSKQEQHERRVRQRRPPFCEEDVKGSLLPLKELHPLHNEYFYMSQRVAKLSQEEKFIRYHGEIYNHAKTILQVCAEELKDGDAPGGGVVKQFQIPGFTSFREAADALQDFQRSKQMRQNFFVNVNNEGAFRCGCLLYNLSREPTAMTTDEGSHSFFDEDALLSGADNVIHPMGAMGLGSTPQDAKVLCVAHALEIINKLQLPLFPFDPARQEEYSRARKKLFLPAVDVSEANAAQAAVPLVVQQKIIPLHFFDAEDESGFIPRLAFSGPSLQHHPRRSARLPPASEVERMISLKDLADFVPFDDKIVGEFVSFYQPIVSEWFQRTHQPECGNFFSATRASTSSHHASASYKEPSLRSVVVDEGNAGKHRSTSWRHVFVPKAAIGPSPTMRPRPEDGAGANPVEQAQGGAGYEIVTCVGRGIRLKEGDRFCIIHIALMLNSRGLLQINPGKEKKHRQLLSMIGLEPQPYQFRPMRRFVAPQLELDRLAIDAFEGANSSSGGGNGSAFPSGGGRVVEGTCLEVGGDGKQTILSKENQAANQAAVTLHCSSFGGRDAQCPPLLSKFIYDRLKQKELVQKNKLKWDKKSRR